MALSAEDERLIESMRQRELNMKKRQRASNAIFHESRRQRRVLVALVALVVGGVVTAIFVSVEITHFSWRPEWRPAILFAAIGAGIGVLLGEGLLRTRPGRRLLTKERGRLNRKYSGDLRVGGRWMLFYYQGENISYYVPQILYVIDSEHRFDSVREALDFVKQSRQENTQAAAYGLQQFNAVAAQTNIVALSSVTANGQPLSRLLVFVKSDRPGVWYVTTAPDGVNNPGIDGGMVALSTPPTQDGATITSNHVRIRRLEMAFMDVAELYRAQAPGYLDGMTEEDQRLEVVYELTLESAEVYTWASHDLVSLRELNQSAVIPPQRRQPQRRGRPSLRGGA